MTCRLQLEGFIEVVFGESAVMLEDISEGTVEGRKEGSGVRPDIVATFVFTFMFSLTMTP